jgi:hypothetical protein
MGPAQRTKGQNQDKGLEKDKNKEALVVGKGLKVAAEAWAGARGPVNKILPINNMGIKNQWILLTLFWR